MNTLQTTYLIELILDHTDNQITEKSQNTPQYFFSLLCCNAFCYSIYTRCYFFLMDFIMLKSDYMFHLLMLKSLLLTDVNTLPMLTSPPTVYFVTAFFPIAFTTSTSL